MLEDNEICQLDKIVVVIGNVPKLNCLGETEVTQRYLNWYSTNEVKQYTFKGNTTVLNLTNKAKTISEEALDWYKQQRIAAFIFVVEHRFDTFSFQLLNRSVSGGSNGCFVIELTYLTVPLVDITQFCKGLQNQTDALCKESLVLCPQLDQYTKRRTDGNKCNLSELKELSIVIKAHVDAHPEDFLFGINLMECYLEAYELLFLEYFQYVKSGDRKQAVVRRRKVADMLQNCSNCLHKQFEILFQKDMFDYLYLCVHYAKWSLWLNPDLSNLNETIIDICQKSKDKLEQEKINAIRSNDQSQILDYVVPEHCLNLIRGYQIRNWNNFKCRIEAAQKLDLIGGHQVVFLRFFKILTIRLFLYTFGLVTMRRAHVNFSSFVFETP